jgi:hypothetical protein
MKFKNILVASMIMGAGVFASSAYAANVAETANATLTNNGVGGLRTLVGNAWDAENSGNTFTDKFLFTLTGNYNGSGTLSSTFESTSPVQDLLISSYSLVKYDPVTDTILNTYAGYNVLGVPGTGTEDYWKFTTTGLTAGSYYIAVNGVIQGAGGGTYTSNVNFALAPVPEPETYAMMAAGLGLLGFMARRRKSAKQA